MDACAIQKEFIALSDDTQKEIDICETENGEIEKRRPLYLTSAAIIGVPGGAMYTPYLWPLALFASAVYAASAYERYGLKEGRVYKDEKFHVRKLGAIFHGAAGVIGGAMSLAMQSFDASTFWVTACTGTIGATVSSLIFAYDMYKRENLDRDVNQSKIYFLKHELSGIIQPLIYSGAMISRVANTDALKKLAKDAGLYKRDNTASVGQRHLSP